MSAMAAGAAAPPRERHVFPILILWLAAAGLIVGQYLLLGQIFAFDRSIARTSVHPLVPSEEWRIKGTLLPLLLILGALTLQNSRLKGTWHFLSILITTLFIPFALLCLLIAAVRGPTSIEAVRLSGGQHFTLAIEPILTDAVYTLYEDADPAGLVWRQASWLDYSEDGRFTGEEHLIVSPDEHWLLVTRAGVWTDCFRLVSGRPVRIEVQPYPDWNSPDYESNMRLRSQHIAALTGLRL